MDIVLFVFGLLWIVGWLFQLATVHYLVRKSGEGYPHDYFRWTIPLLLFFTWPYFTIYRIVSK